MLKKFLSVLLILSILFPDIAHCGGVWGRENREDDAHCITKRQTTDFSDSATGEWTEGTPLVQEGRGGINSSDTFSSELPTPSGSFDFHAFSQDPQEKNLASWARERRTESSNHEEEQKVGGLTLLETSDEEDLTQGIDHIVLDGAGLPQSPYPSASEKWLKIDPTNEKRSSLNAQRTSINQGSGNQDELTEFVVVSQELPSPLSFDELLSSLKVSDLAPEVQEFLRYVKVRVVDGKLNWKQGLGIFGGLATGASSAFTLITLFAWEAEIAVSIAKTGAPYDFSVFEDLMKVVEAAVYIYVPFAILETISRTSSFFIEALADNINLFLTKKTLKNRMALGLSKLCLYGGSFITGLLSAYYIFLQKIVFGEYFDERNEENFTFTPLDILIWTGVVALVLDTTLHYGHQLSHYAESWLNAYFNHKIREESLLTVTEKIRKRYLSTFTELKKFLYRLDKGETNRLYEAIFDNSISSQKKVFGQENEELNIKEALYIIDIFVNFHRFHHNTFIFDSSQSWKENIASKVGWCLSLLASVGRHIVFWQAFYEVLETITLELGVVNLEPLKMPLSIILGGCIAGLTQGFIEKDATQKAVYDMLGGETISKATSHGFLRRSIMLWNSVLGTIGITPYITAGLYITYQCYYEESHEICWPLWARIACFVPFGLAHAYTRTQSFHDSILNILNGFDSLMSYCYPFQGYKRDKLIRMTRELHKLFKNLDTDVLETVDQLLTPLPAEQEVGSLDSKRLMEELV